MIMGSYMIMMMMIAFYMVHVMDDDDSQHDVTGHVVHCSAGSHKRLRDSRRILSAQHSWPLLSLYSSPGGRWKVFSVKIEIAVCGIPEIKRTQGYLAGD